MRSAESLKATFVGHYGNLRLCGVFAVALAVIIAGCHRGEVLGEVWGRLTFEGEPVTDAVVIFRNQAKGVYMTAEVNNNGEFRPDMAGGYGLPLGEYEVFISPPVQDAPVGPALAPPEFFDLSKMPARYRDPTTSGLQLTVERGENRFDIDMQP